MDGGVTVVERPDLSTRTALSKSVLTAFELCETKSWLSIHDPRPFVPNEKVVFGSAVDAGVEVIVKSLSSGQRVDDVRVYEAANFIAERDEMRLDFAELQAAFIGFKDEVAPKFDWSLAITQANITTTVGDLGECNGHPDIIMGSGSVWDVKTSGRAKEVPSLELGFYALLMEEHTAAPVPSVGYFNWVRLKRPYWQIAEAPVTDELRRWAYEKAAAYVRAKKADVLINAKSAKPLNYSFPGSAKFASLCADCPYNPALGGPCLVAMQEENAA
jgi:hypothetical protein